MKRYESTPRTGFKDIIEKQGLLYHTSADGTPYWQEDSYYSLSLREVQKLETAASELHQMFLEAVGHVIDNKQLDRLFIPKSLHPIIEKSWVADDWEFYGRFDFTFDPYGTPKLIEYNADTPTGLLEASIIQWYWKQDLHPNNDQFNSLHEKLVNRWKELVEHQEIKNDLTHFTSVNHHPEDRMNVSYIQSTAEEAGLTTNYIPIERIGWNKKKLSFVDEQENNINQMFKLYPWEWMGNESFSSNLTTASWKVLEPAWKAVVASKGLMLVMQELFPNHENLLKVADKPTFRREVKKPMFGREGANVTISIGDSTLDCRDGKYGNDQFIYQEYCPLIKTYDFYAQCGVWMVGPDVAGCGVREDNRAIMGNTTKFVPHIID